jgi:PKD repeat protein
VDVLPSVEKDKKGNNPPTCSLSASPSTGNVPLIVSFSMLATDTDGSISSWELDVNDDGVSEYSGLGNPPTKKEYIFENLSKTPSSLFLF